MPDYAYWIIFAVAGLLAGGVLGIVIGTSTGKKKGHTLGFEEGHKEGYDQGYETRKNEAEALIGSAEKEAKRIVERAKKEGDSKKKEMLVEAREEILKAKQESDRENKERRQEVIRLENRAIAKEESLDKKIENYERKEELLNKKIKENEQITEDLNALTLAQQKKLEEISSYTREQAKAEIVKQIEDDARKEASVKIVEIEQELKEEANKKASEIISIAIQRMASDYVSESTVSVVTLPSDEMKGRIIGREGRNIHKIETLTGCDLIVDDTPEAITLSCFDPIRRDIAKRTLEKLIADGRIHPTRIEEMVEKAGKEVDSEIKAAGEQALIDSGVNTLGPELTKILGRLKYRTSYGQNVLNHSVEVARLAGMMASELGLDPTLAKRAGLLHDIGKALTQEVEGSHVQLGVELCKKFKENKDVIHAIEAHHGDVEPKTVVAVLVAAADALSAARPGARHEDLESYIKRLQKLEEIANTYPGVEKSYAMQAGREIRIMVKPDAVNDDQIVIVAKEIVKKIEEDLEYPGQIKVNVIRENRVVDYAK